FLPFGFAQPRTQAQNFLRKRQLVTHRSAPYPDYDLRWLPARRVRGTEKQRDEMRCDGPGRSLNAAGNRSLAAIQLLCPIDLFDEGVRISDLLRSKDRMSLSKESQTMF